VPLRSSRTVTLRCAGDQGDCHSFQAARYGRRPVGKDTAWGRGRTDDQPERLRDYVGSKLDNGGLVIGNDVKINLLRLKQVKR
jgi:hypothetical protein